MGYETALRLTLVPAGLLFLLSLVSIVLTAHYWILTDWITGRWVEVQTQYDADSNSWTTDDTIVDYIAPSTNATIVSGCLSLAAAVTAFIAWKKLRANDMDTDYKAPYRQFWTIIVHINATAGFAAAMASIITHYTDKGDDQFGCHSHTQTMSGKSNTNKFCSREMGACSFLKHYKAHTSDAWASDLACNEAVAVKWIQIPLMLLALILMAMFGLQARMRSKTRYSRAPNEPSPY